MRPAVQKNLNVCEKIQTFAMDYPASPLSVQDVETIVRNAYVKKKNHY